MRPTAMPMRNALTIDVEDWYHDAEGLGAAAAAPPEPRVERNLRRLLDLLDAHRTHATLFVLGEVAERFAALVREAFDRGHEIASHGDRHRSVRTLLRREFRADVARSLERLEDLTGARVLGYRAPYFSIKAGVYWPADVLAEVGVGYDSIGGFALRALPLGFVEKRLAEFNREVGPADLLRIGSCRRATR